MSGSIKTLLGFLVVGTVVAATAWILLDDSSTNATATAGIPESSASRTGGEVDASDLSREEETSPGVERNVVDSDVPQTSEEVLMSAAVTGAVVDEHGNAIAGAEVTLGPPAFGRRSTRSYGFIGRSISIGSPGDAEDEVATTTNEEGQFTFASAPLGAELHLLIRHPEFVTFDRSGFVIPERGFDFGRIALQPGATVTGTVFAPGGALLPDVEIWFNETPAEEGGPMIIRMPSFGPSADRIVKTDEHGNFRLAGLKEGEGTVAAALDGYLQAESGKIKLRKRETTKDVDVHLCLGLVIRGVVVDVEGKPIEGASVRTSGVPFMKMHIPDPEDDVKTDSSGQFILNGLEAGRHDLSAVARSYSTEVIEGVEAGKSEPLQIVLRPAGRVTGKVLSMSGKPVEEFDLQVQPDFGGGFARPFLTEDRVEFEKGADPGSFVIDDVEPGDYVLNVRADGYCNGGSSAFEVIEGKTTEHVEVKLENGAWLRGRLVDRSTQQPIVNARVIAEVEESASSGFDFMVAQTRRLSKRLPFMRGSESNVATDSNGEFDLSNLPAGRYRLRAARLDYAPLLSDWINLEKAEQKENILLQALRGGSLEGVVYGADNRPSMGERVRAVCATEESFQFEGVSDGDGSYRIDHLPPGDYRCKRDESASMISVGKGQYFAIETGSEQRPDDELIAKVEDGKVTTLDFSSHARSSVEGKITSSAGPLAQASVQLMPLNGEDNDPWNFLGMNERLMTTTGPDGGYRLENVGPGHYRIQVRHKNGLVPFRDELDVAEGVPARKDMFLEGGTIHGTVISSDGARKIADAIVRLEEVQPEGNAVSTSVGVVSFAFSAPAGRGRRGARMLHTSLGSPMSSTKTDADGNFEIPWVPAGKFRVGVEHPEFIEGRSTSDLEMEGSKRVDAGKVVLEAGGWITVEVLSTDSRRPVANQPVHLKNADGGFLKVAVTDSDGRCIFDSLKPGDYAVEILSFGSNDEPPSRSATVASGRETRVTLDN